MNYEGSANQGNIIYTMRRDGDADHDAPTWHHSSDKGEEATRVWDVTIPWNF